MVSGNGNGKYSYGKLTSKHTSPLPKGNTLCPVNCLPFQYWSKIILNNKTENMNNQNFVQEEKTLMGVSKFIK